MNKIKRHKNYKMCKSYVVPEFSDLMINQLAKHSDKGDNWKDVDSYLLLNRAKEELEEVRDALGKIVMACPSQKEVDCLARECADVANFMMMIVDSVRE